MLGHFDKRYILWFQRSAKPLRARSSWTRRRASPARQRQRCGEAGGKAAVGRDHREDQRAVQGAVHRRGQGAGGRAPHTAAGRKKAAGHGKEPQSLNLPREHLPEGVRHGGIGQLYGVSGHLHIAV